MRLSQAEFDRQYEVTKLLLDGISTAHVSSVAIVSVLFQKVPPSFTEGFAVFSSATTLLIDNSIETLLVRLHPPQMSTSLPEKVINIFGATHYVMFKTRAPVFYRDFLPRVAAEWF